MEVRSIEICSSLSNDDAMLMRMGGDDHCSSAAAAARRDWKEAASMAQQPKEIHNQGPTWKTRCFENPMF